VATAQGGEVAEGEMAQQWTTDNDNTHNNQTEITGGGGGLAVVAETIMMMVLAAVAARQQQQPMRWAGWPPPDEEGDYDRPSYAWLDCRQKNSCTAWGKTMTRMTTTTSAEVDCTDT
jgi:hypothetical protein